MICCPSKSLSVKLRDGHTHFIVTLPVCHYNLYKNLLSSEICLTLRINIFYVCIFVFICLFHNSCTVFFLLRWRLSVLEQKDYLLTYLQIQVYRRVG